jgi:hypothetical protein
MNKFGEPWYRRQSVVDSDELLIETTPPGMMDDKKDVRRDRIIACVNACADMENPAEELAALEAELAEAKKQLEFCATSRVSRMKRLRHSEAELALTRKALDAACCELRDERNITSATMPTLRYKTASEWRKRFMREAREAGT